jgi:hypothetical protein
LALVFTSIVDTESLNWLGTKGGRPTPRTSRHRRHAVRDHTHQCGRQPEHNKPTNRLEPSHHCPCLAVLISFHRADQDSVRRTLGFANRTGHRQADQADARRSTLLVTASQRRLK